MYIYIKTHEVPYCTASLTGHLLLLLLLLNLYVGLSLCLSNVSLPSRPFCSCDLMKGL